MRIPFVLALFTYGSLVAAQRPNLESLIEQLACTDTTCMNSYASRFDLCYWGEEKDQPVWASCEVVVQKGPLRTDVPCALMRICGPEADGESPQGYGITTNDPKYVRKLMKQLRRLELNASEKVRGGGVVHTDPQDPEFYIVQMDPKELPFMIAALRMQARTEVK